MKKALRVIWNEFVYGGHLLSLGAVSIVFTASILLNIQITWDFLLIVYLGTESVYLYNRFKEYKIDFLTNLERTAHIKKYVKFIPLTIITSFLIIFSILIYKKNIPSLLFVIFLLIVGFLYSEIFKNFTKKIIGFKGFFVSLTWAFLIIFLNFYYFQNFNLAFLLLFLFVFLRFLVSTNFFDFKDIESDKKEGLLTLPIILGKENLIKTLWIINVLATIPIIFGFSVSLFPIYSLMLTFTIPYTFYYFQKLKKATMNQNFLNYVVVDGEFILWSFAILLGKILVWVI